MKVLMATTRQSLLVAAAVLVCTTPNSGASVLRPNRPNNAKSGIRMEVGSVEDDFTAFLKESIDSDVDAGAESSPNHEKPQDRDLIVGGTRAAAGEFPWFVASTGNGFCGGSLVAPSVVLTAAHCDTLFGVGRNVVVGAVERNSLVGGAVSRRVTRYVPHPDYNEDTLAYDLMLLQLDRPVTTTEPLAWNTDNSLPAADTPVTVMGFGRQAFDDGETSEDLLKVELATVADNVCQRRYGRNSLFLDTMMCAMRPDSSDTPQSACQGDSGGPLVMMTTDARTGNTYPLQVGVVSWGIGCAHDFFPGVYARPSGAARNWMETTICQLSPECTPSPAAAPTTQPPVTVTNILKVTVFYDEFPQETTWSVVRVNSNGREQEVVVSGPTNDPEPFSGYIYTITGIASGSYRFVVLDSAGNGLQNVGSFHITLETTLDATGVLLTSGTLTSFSSRYESQTFVIPGPGDPPATTPPNAPPTRAPTQSPTLRPTPAPAAAPTPPAQPGDPTAAPTLKEPCVCMTGIKGGCLKLFCEAVSDAQLCHSLGCTWLDGDPNATPPPNIENPGDDDDDGDGGGGGDEDGDGGIFTVNEDSSDLEKAGISLVVGLAAALASFIVLSLCSCLLCKPSQPQPPGAPTASANRQPNYPRTINKRGTDTTEESYVFNDDA